MIQRIQSLFLLFAAIITMGVAFLPWWSGETYFYQQGMLINTVVGQTSVYPYLFWGCMAAGGLLFVNIFLFNNRKLQMKLSQLSGVLLSLVFGGGYYLLYEYFNELESSVEGDFTLYYWSLILAIVSNAVARIYIKKDEDLVRSVDRIR